MGGIYFFGIWMVFQLDDEPNLYEWEMFGNQQTSIKKLVFFRFQVFLYIARWLQRILIFTLKIGEVIQFDEHIFWMGGSTTN